MAKYLLRRHQRTMGSKKADAKDLSMGTALKFVILLGIVSLFADATYEGARSIAGAYLAVLGASAAIVGIVSGFGELVGYGLRSLFGYISDKTGKYWTMTILGYGLNLLAVPLLALAGRWEIAAFLMIAERMGKAVRTPARDAMLSHATARTGRGWGFGLHEAMDQIGAMLGPSVVALVLYLKGGYEAAFGLLLIPALLALAVLAAARFLYPRPRDFEPDVGRQGNMGFPRVFWIYLAAVALLAAGFADFPLIAFHFHRVSVVSDEWVPVFYAIAMGVDALAALVFGRLFDRKGIPVMAFAAIISALFAPLVFLGGFYFALLGMVLWGVGMGAQESIMRAAIADMIPAGKRGSAYGLFNTGFGIFWFLGSALMGILYDLSLPSLIAFSVAAQFLSVPLFLWIKRMTDAKAK
jgi:MFS family permease